MSGIQPFDGALDRGRSTGEPALCRLELGEEGFDLAPEIARLLADAFGRTLDLGRRVARRLGRFRDLCDIDRDVAGSGSRLLHVAGDLLRGGALLLDRCRDAACDAADALDGLDNAGNRRARIAGRGLDRGDLASNLLGRLRG